MKQLRTVPVLMYHSVGIPNPNWIWNFLTIPYQIFEDHLRVLRGKGFNTIDLLQLYNYRSTGKPISPNSIVLTFDDGYLDNWVYAYPLLKKYGFKGTVFVNPEFVDPTEEYRLNLEDVWNGKVKEEDLKPHGFLSWHEMRQMEKDGVMDVQSHGMTHTWYFTDPEIIDFRHPGDTYVWMNWNKDINRKHKYLTENQDDLIELGAPVYQHEKSFSARRYYPDKLLDKTLIHYVKENGGKDFFKSKSWRNQLFRVVENYKNKSLLEDGYESEEKKVKRFEWELKESKSILEQKLEKEIRYFCWPGGGYTNLSRNIANKYYLSTTLASWDQTVSKNAFGEDPKNIKRMAVNYIEGRKDGTVKYLSGYYHYLCIRDFRGEPERKLLRKLLKGITLLKYRCFP
jgi:peptidoglycan/xylan/chitin deacetylase (PgdA/CDA1 family)